MGFGIYYDDPKKVVDQEKCRMIGGIILDPQDEVNDSEKIQAFLKKNRDFRYAFFKKCPSLYTYFPYFNYASFNMANKRIWRALRLFLRKNPKYKDFGLCQGDYIEIYNLEDPDFKNRRLEYWWPLGKMNPGEEGDPLLKQSN